MSLEVRFGHGGNSSQWFLGNAAIASANLAGAGAPGTTSTNALSFLTKPTWSNQLLFNGLVRANSVDETHSFDVVHGWNSVKNFEAVSTADVKLVADGFVHVDILAIARDEDADQAGSTITVFGAKRGNILTGNDADTITIHMVSNGGWVETFNISTGGGDDTIILTGLNLEGQAAEGDTTYANSLAGTLFSTGQGQSSFIDAGAGNDTVQGFGSRDFINGGAGNDSLRGGGGNDSVAGGGDNDWVHGDAGNDTVHGGADGGKVTLTTISVTVNLGGSSFPISFTAPTEVTIGDNVQGGTGADIFRYDIGSDGVDRFLDFNYADGDRIDIADHLFDGILSAGNAEVVLFAFQGGSLLAFSSAPGAFTADAGIILHNWTQPTALSLASIFV
ncbi:MAG TPA: hypothetical protein VE033_17370 [Acetobacteraceae bacterium]|nr:hypothetical protein [Acetobacteraceae bacterium]